MKTIPGMKVEFNKETKMEIKQKIKDSDVKQRPQR